MAVANAILSESALSYLGLGVVPPTPSWGNMMDAANSLIDFQRRPRLWMPPGLAIFVTVVAINILGDGLRDALDPKMNGVTRWVNRWWRSIDCRCRFRRARAGAGGAAGQP